MKLGELTALTRGELLRSTREAGSLSVIDGAEALSITRGAIYKKEQGLLPVFDMDLQTMAHSALTMAEGKLALIQHFSALIVKMTKLDASNIVRND